MHGFGDNMKARQNFPASAARFETKSPALFRNTDAFCNTKLIAFCNPLAGAPVKSLRNSKAARIAPSGWIFD